MKMSVSQKSNQLFKNPILERFSRTNAIFVISSLFVVSGLVLFYGIWALDISLPRAIILFFIGLFSFSLAEYLIHRFVFHFGDYTNEKQWQSKIHGVHHLYPTDKERLALPLPLAIVLSALTFGIFWWAMGAFAAAFTPGFISGYAFYLLVHFRIHTRRPPKNFFSILWKHHHIHHHVNEYKAYGVTTPFWDYIFQTMPDKNTSSKNLIRKWTN